jgi:hypothetical protein
VNLYGIDENHKNIKSVDNDGNSPCDDELNSNDLGDASCCETDFRYHYAGIGNSENKCYPEIPMLVDSCSGVAPQVDCEKSMTEGDQAGERVLLPCEWDSLNNTCGVAPRRPDMVPAVDVTYMSLPDPFAATGSDDLDFFNSYIDNRSFNYKTGAQFNTACGGTTGENGNFWTWDATTTPVQIKHCNSTIDTQSSQDVPHARGPGPDPVTQDPIYMSSGSRTNEEKRRSVEYGIKGFPTRINDPGTTLVNDKNGINFVSDTYYYEDYAARSARMAGLPPTPIMATKMQEVSPADNPGDYNNCVATCLEDDDCDLIKATVNDRTETRCSLYKLEKRQRDSEWDIGGYPLAGRLWSGECGFGGRHDGDRQAHLPQGQQCSILLQGDNIVDEDVFLKPVIILKRETELTDLAPATDIVDGKEGREWVVSGVYLEQGSSDYVNEPHENLDHAVAGPVVSWGDYAARPNEPAIYARDSLGRLIGPRFTSQVGVAGKAFTYLGLIFGDNTWSYVSETGGTVNGIVPEERRYWKKKGEGSNPDIFLFNAAANPSSPELWLLSTKLTIYWGAVPEADKIASPGGFVIAQLSASAQRDTNVQRVLRGLGGTGEYAADRDDPGRTLQPPLRKQWDIYWGSGRTEVAPLRDYFVLTNIGLSRPGRIDVPTGYYTMPADWESPQAQPGWKSNPRTKESNENILRTITGVWSDTDAHPPALRFQMDDQAGCSGEDWCKGEQWISMNKIRA